MPGAGTPTAGSKDTTDKNAGDIEQQVLANKRKASPFDSIKIQHTGTASAQTSFAMGQTMSAQASRAMVSQIKSGNSATGKKSKNSASSAQATAKQN